MCDAGSAEGQRAAQGSGKCPPFKDRRVKSGAQLHDHCIGRQQWPIAQVVARATSRLSSNELRKSARRNRSLRWRMAQARDVELRCSPLRAQAL